MGFNVRLFISVYFNDDEGEGGKKNIETFFILFAPYNYNVLSF